MAKETLGAQDQQFWLGTLTALDAGMSSRQAQTMQRNFGSFQGAIQGYAGNLGVYDAQNTQAFNFASSERNRLLGASQALSDTSSGLAYLYGFNKQDKQKTNPLAPNSAINKTTANNFATA
jgi:hypothetical protein